MKEYKGRDPKKLAEIAERKRLQEKEEIIKLTSSIKGRDLFLEQIKTYNYARMLKIFEVIYNDKSEFNKIHQSVYCEENIKKAKSIINKIDLNQLLTDGLYKAIKKFVDNNCKEHREKLEKTERNKLVRERRKENRNKKQMELRQTALIKEVNNIFKRTNYHSDSCRKRYQKACINFVKWLSAMTRTTSIVNIKQEQLMSYIEYLKFIGDTYSTARLEIYAIFYLERFIKFRYELNKKQLLLEVDYIYGKKIRT